MNNYLSIIMIKSLTRFFLIYISQMMEPRKRELTLSLTMCQTLYIHYLRYSSRVPRLREVKSLPKVT